MHSRILGILLAVAIIHAAIPQGWACLCTRVLSPVCGSNNKTYSNQCLLECEQSKDPGLTKASDGDCAKSETKPEEIPEAKAEEKPQTKPEEKPEAKPEVLTEDELQGRGLQHRGCKCIAGYDPHCGSDGKTYSNPCNFRCMQRRNLQLRRASKGPCRMRTGKNMAKKVAHDCACEDGWHPVCGTDRRTYSNECKLQCEKIMSPTLEKAYGGECIKGYGATRPRCVCSQVYSPICGTDGVIYGNKCEFTCARKANPKLKKASAGECLLCGCSDLSDPVCGSDGESYLNECELQCMRKNPGKLLPLKALKKAHNGKCCNGKRIWQRLYCKLSRFRPSLGSIFRRFSSKKNTSVGNKNRSIQMDEYY